MCVLAWSRMCNFTSIFCDTIVKSQKQHIKRQSCVIATSSHVRILLLSIFYICWRNIRSCRVAKEERLSPILRSSRKIARRLISVYFARCIAYIHVHNSYTIYCYYRSGSPVRPAHSLSKITAANARQEYNIEDRNYTETHTRLVSIGAPGGFS